MENILYPKICPLCHFDVKPIKRIQSCICLKCEQCKYTFCLEGKGKNCLACREQQFFNRKKGAEMKLKNKFQTCLSADRLDKIIKVGMK